MEKAVTAPRLSRTSPPPYRTGIVHLGLGAFFRAFGAVYVAEAMARSGGDWGILGVSLRSAATRDALAPQGNLYTALELAPAGERARQVDVLTGVLVAPENRDAVLAAMVDPAVKIVSLTVTEKGYCHVPATGALDLDHADIVHDRSAALPVSAPGFIVRALARRRAAGLRPFTVLSCDNLPGNGRLTRNVVLALARLIDPTLADWIAAEGRFPSTMVDRIVPATKADDIARLAALTGCYDAAPVVHEPFRQWVVEDDFVGGERPDLAAVGVRLVADVTPYEDMKLRLLNATHSALAYLGFLAGHETIADTVADPPFAVYVRQLWRAEIIPALVPPPGEDLAAYAAALFARYANPAIRHRTAQIASDGSQKLRPRLFATLAANAAAGRRSPGLMLAIAGWMRYVGGLDEAGRAIAVSDPHADALRALSDSAVSPATKAEALLGFRPVFPADIAALLHDGVVEAAERLDRLGARAAVAALIKES